MSSESSAADIQTLPDLLITVGLPRSGKTSYARDAARKGAAGVVSVDAIRRTVHGQPLRAEAEDLVWMLAKLMVRSLFAGGYMLVVVDDCHPRRVDRDFWHHPDEWRSLLMPFGSSKAECQKRARADGDERLVEVIAAMDAGFEPLGNKTGKANGQERPQPAARDQSV